MAGTNQAVNLGGMLSQIGNTLAAPVDMSGLTRNIQNMARPDVDPNDPDSLRKLMEFQNKMGRTNEAAVTMAQVRDMSAKQEEQRKLNVQKATQAAKSRFAEALASGDQTKIANEQRILRSMGSQFGIDAEGIMSEVKSTQQNEQIRGIQLSEAQAAQSTRREKEQLGAVIAKADIQPGSSQWKALVNSPLGQKHTDYLRNYEANELQLQEARARNEERVMELNDPPSFKYLESKISDPALPQERRDYYNEQLESFKKTANSSMKDGTWVNATVKRRFNAELGRIEQEAGREVFNLQEAQRDEETRMRNTNSKIDKQIAAYRPDKWEVEMQAESLGKDLADSIGWWKNDVGGDTPLDEKAAKALAARLKQPDRAEEFKGLTLNQLAEDMLRANYRQNLEAAKETMPERATSSEPASGNLPSPSKYKEGTTIRGKDGETYTLTNGQWRK